MASYNVQLKNGPGDDLYPIVRNIYTDMPPPGHVPDGTLGLYLGTNDETLTAGQVYIADGDEDDAREWIAISCLLPKLPSTDAAPRLYIQNPRRKYHLDYYIPIFTYGENNTEYQTGDDGCAEVEDGTLFTTTLTPGELNVRGFSIGDMAQQKDLNFGLLVIQEDVTGSLAITCKDKNSDDQYSVWWSDGAYPPEFNANNPMPAIGKPNYLYMIRLHWQADIRVLLANLEYMVPNAYADWNGDDDENYDDE